jgi:hypothetical protein
MDVVERGRVFPSSDQIILKQIVHCLKGVKLVSALRWMVELYTINVYIQSNMPSSESEQIRGVGGNERANRLATIANGQPMDLADIVNALREICRGEDFEGGESTSLVRMK